MKKITRSKSDDATNKADEIYSVAAALLEKVERRPNRLVGISLSGFTDNTEKQISLFEDVEADKKSGRLENVAMDIQKKYGLDSIKSGSEMIAEKRILKDREKQK